MDIQNRIKKIRDKNDLSQRAFAERINVSGAFIAQLETGTRTIKDIHIAAICREFSVSENWLRTGDGNMFIIPDEDLAFEDIWTNIRRSDSENADFIKRIVKAYWTLSPDKQAAIMELINKVAEK